MKASLLLLGSILLCSGVLQAAGVCTSPDTMTLGCIYSNLGPGETYIDGTGLSPAYLADAVPFTPTASYILRDIEIAAYRANADVPDSVRFSIYQEVSGAPGYDPVSGFPGTGLLESFTLSGLGIFGGDPAPGTVTAQSVLHPALSAGVRYWIVMDGVNPGDVTWNDNAASQFGVATVLAPNGGNPARWSSLQTSYLQGAFALDGTPTPEPATALLAAVALCGIGIRAATKSSVSSRN